MVLLLKNPSVGVEVENLPREPEQQIKFLHVGLINTHSIRTKSLIVPDHITAERFNLLTLTKTWQSECCDADLIKACPKAFSACHIPRMSGRGGGLAIIYRISIAVSLSPI